MSNLACFRQAIGRCMSLRNAPVGVARAVPGMMSDYTPAHGYSRHQQTLRQRTSTAFFFAMAFAAIAPAVISSPAAMIADVFNPATT